MYCLCTILSWNTIVTSIYIFSNLYLDKNGDVIKIGTHVVDRELAETLKIIREKPNDFYTGDLAAKIVRDVKEAGGDISFDDLQNYKVVQREIIHSSIDNLDMHTMSDMHNMSDMHTRVTQEAIFIRTTKDTLK